MMTPAATTTTRPQSPTENAFALIDTLSESGSSQSVLAELRESLNTIIQEHSGMADELLRAYEQLGIVFEVTRRLMTLRSEAEVIDVFIESLKMAYADARCLVVLDEADVAEALPDSSTSSLQWLREAIERAPQQRQVHVVRSGTEVGIADGGVTGHTDQALLAPVYAGDSFVCAIVLLRPAGQEARDLWESGDMLLLDSLSTFCGDTIRNFRLVQELQQMSMEMVRSLVSAIDQKDPYTSGHTNRVAYYARMLGVEAGFDKAQLRTLEWSALLHDVGKIGIRDDVLNKQGKLTDEEFAHIKEHPLRGFEVVKEVPHMREAVDGVLYHHERYDGKGYPKGLAGEQIPLQARIIQIADIFDALTTTRSYRNAFHWRKALKILHDEAGTVVDPNLGEMFVAMLDRCYQADPSAFDVIGTPGAVPNLAGANDSVEQGD